MKSKRTREKPRRFVLKELLGSGTYNCAYHLTEDGTVLRIGFLPSSDKDPIVERGLEIVNVFQSFQNRLGPSLLQEISKYQIIPQSKLDKYVEGNLCESIVKSIRKEGYNDENKFALQQIEYLQGGVFSAASLKNKSIILSKKEVRFFTFSLIWFFAMSQQLFSFRHHDLKSDNIMIRAGSMNVYNFEIEQKSKQKIRYEFYSHFVPVVIDYDFGSVYQKNTDTVRNRGGTYYTRAPDALLYSLYQRSGIDFDFTYNPHVYDYWSIGICMFELLHFFYKGIWNLFNDECTEFTEAVLKTNFFGIDAKDDDETRYLIHSILYGLCFINAVSEEPFTTSLRPPKKLYGALVKRIDWNHWNSEIHEYSNDYKALVDAFQNDFPDELKKIVRKLLHVDPSERNAHNKPMDLILQSKYFKKADLRTKAPQDSFKGKNGPILSDEELVQKSGNGPFFLEGKVCSVCFVEANLAQTFYLCECCAKPFCGVECQIKKH
jgi:serine/threonine protein kinase